MFEGLETYSVEVRAKIFMKTEANIMEAIESLIREPYGCFE